MNHTFHQTIYRALDINIASGRFFWEQACGGSQHVSLFREAIKSRCKRYACVDALLIVNSSVRLILEIEEAGSNGFLPTRIMGKLATSAICRFFIAGYPNQPIPFSKEVLFVQIVNSAGLKPASRKPAQYSNLERDIRERLMPLGSITDYRLIAGDAATFVSGDEGTLLRRLVMSVG